MISDETWERYKGDLEGCYNKDYIMVELGEIHWSFDDWLRLIPQEDVNLVGSHYHAYNVIFEDEDQ